MRYHCLACDYDGTIAHHGRVDAPTLAALERLRATGRKLILVTGRELDELLTVFPDLHLFEWVVAENGGLLYRPATREEKLLGPPPAGELVALLHKQRVWPLSVGRVLVATWQPHETVVLEAIQTLGLELQVIFNKGAVMILPSGVNKATGLAAALHELEMSAHEVVGIGDAENDHAFLALCEASAAVANALPALKEHADVVTQGDHGVGVSELIELLVADDLRGLSPKLARHFLRLGHRDDGVDVTVPPYGLNLLIAGPSGSGKSTVATSFLERLVEQGYQFCIIDPEGDYEKLEHAVTLGNNQRAPTVDEVLGLLKSAADNAVVNLVGLPLADRPPFFLALLPRLQEMRGRTGRPHWLIVDEAHHLLPASWEPGALALPQALRNVVLITVHPDQVAPAALRMIDALLIVGPETENTIRLFCRAAEQALPEPPALQLAQGEVIFWQRKPSPQLWRVRLVPARAERTRHSRKYAEGELPPERSFYFKGPEGKLNLRAQNLFLFLQIADGVDDATWLHHLRRGDYSHWFRERIKDDVLADEAAAIEERAELQPAEARTLMRQAVERYYTLPATATLPMPGADAASGRG